MKRYLVFFILFCLTISGYAQSETGTVPFKIYDTHSGDQITLTELADRLGNTEVLFWGEEHNDSVGHILELKMLKLLSERYFGKLCLSMEMFETDCQAVLNDYLGDFIAKDKFIKEARAWNNYSDYSPMVDYAKENRIPVVAANAPRRYVNLVSRRGLKSLDSLSDLSGSYVAKLKTPAPKGRYYKKFLGIMGGAENVHSPHMFASQCLWDATMARSIDNAHKDQKKGGLVFHICGRFHCDEYLGTALRLHQKNKNLNIATISCFPAADFDQHYAELADYVILTKN